MLTCFLYSGTSLSIKATGTVDEQIEEGAYLKVQVKYGMITLVRTQLDFCEQTEKADLKCPIKKGALEVNKDVDIPKEVPPVSTPRAWMLY